MSRIDMKQSRTIMKFDEHCIPQKIRPKHQYGAVVNVIFKSSSSKIEFTLYIPAVRIDSEFIRI